MKSIEHQMGKIEHSRRIIGNYGVFPWEFSALKMVFITLSLIVLAGGRIASAQVNPQSAEKPVDRELFSSKVKPNPLVTFYVGDYVEEVFEMINSDTGSDFSSAKGDSVLSLSTKKKDRIFIVKSETGDACGNKYRVFKRGRRSHNKRGAFSELLQLECAEGVYLTRKKSFTSGYPDLLYVSGKKPTLYSTHFKYDGEKYREFECMVQIGNNPDKHVSVDCIGKGIVQH